jgi:hypothetical protein
LLVPDRERWERVHELHRLHADGDDASQQVDDVPRVADLALQSFGSLTMPLALSVLKPYRSMTHSTGEREPSM